MKRLYAIGIDFGTSNSCVCQACYLRRPNGTLDSRPIKPPEPVSIHYRDTVPTAIFLGGGYEAPVFGEVAEEKALFYPELTKTNFKMQLGVPGDDGAAAFDYTTRFLRFLREELQSVIPFDAPEDQVEITTCVGHPVQWNADQRELTRLAAIKAGFPNVAIEDESAAAIYDHLCEETLRVEPGKKSLILVVDMGGGTTDFAFVELSGDPTEAPITTPVDPSRLTPPWEDKKQTYGGRDLDELMLRYFAHPWGITRHNRDWTFLLRETRRFKEQFSQTLSSGRPGYRTQWFIENSPKEVRLTRDNFEDLANAYIQHLPRLIHGALSLGGVRAEDVNAVILTGGHSRWYWVEDAVRTAFPHISHAGGTLVRHRNPDQSVARGCAYKTMIEAAGGRPRPRRRATHAIWLATPEPAARSVAAPPVNIGPVATMPTGTPDDPVIVVDRGQLLPFHTPAPAKLSIQKMDFDPLLATLRLKLYSGSSERSRQELLDRVAQFDRPFWESTLKKISRHLPWSTSLDTDEFDVEVLCSVDENELFTGKVTITRYYRGRPSQQQVQMLELNGPRAPVPTFS